MKNVYQTKQSKLKIYKNEVWDIVHNLFLAFNTSYIPRDENQLDDSLDIVASGFKTVLNTQVAYEI